MHGRGVHFGEVHGGSGQGEEQLSVCKGARRADGAPSGSLCQSPPRPTTRHRHYGPPATTRRGEERTERRDESGLLPLKEGCVEARVRIVLRGEGRLEGKLGRKGCNPCAIRSCVCV